MVSIGNFFFHYRNILFIFLYLLLFLPSPQLFSESVFGSKYYYWPIILGLFITITGQATRGLTIGLSYIIRGGKDRQVYAEELVTTGLFNHARNPLYLGNILMLLGVGILSNSLIYVAVIMPFFIFIYHTIVLAEENFLRNKFGKAFNVYTEKVNRWIPSFQGLSSTVSSMKFNWKRWLIKEYGTQYIWLSGILLVLILRYPVLNDYSDKKRITVAAIILPILLVYYLFIRFMKKTKRWKE